MKDESINSRENTVAAPLRSIRLPSVLFAAVAILPLVGCASGGPVLSVRETPPPELLGAKQIDPAMRERILRAVDQDANERVLRDNLKQHPDNIDAAIGLTKVLLAQKRPDEALDVLDRLLLGAPGSLRALNAKAVVLDVQGRHDAAQALYRQALKIEPENEMLRHNLRLSLSL
ncbi:Flp pilus assembly protein TadD [Sinorhizobium terangae]|uniref:Tetratricopeptide repeat protein n=1 Tax=Sinorhizobium terangae TaxID=110322 RepID=A0A6N7LT76_SINTE|nr:tetratricopeptide repeat protein [Sinorhizobium terangae]MBB4189013.1 Flp pilus assembly protein TadD [Sinorhizobium terangae]MQX19254.1 tetratricopeptide repeat protein [Sinorhizobium terangae]